MKQQPGAVEKLIDITLERLAGDAARMARRNRQPNWRPVAVREVAGELLLEVAAYTNGVTAVRQVWFLHESGDVERLPRLDESSVYDAPSVHRFAGL